MSNNETNGYEEGVFKYAQVFDSNNNLHKKVGIYKISIDRIKCLTFCGSNLHRTRTNGYLVQFVRLR